ncbi:alpha-glucan family phosphorylase [Acidithiobacillus sp. YTS05]|nr:alpha-glucan family phosphorylase [Acidithiobacillus sp. YTS05]
MTPVADQNGNWLRIQVGLPRRTLILRAWQVRLGKVSLYLLDSNDPLNSPADRGITAELYGGAPEMRLQQEICLGVGGWLPLRHLGIEIDICHLNEGHAALAILACLQSHMRDHGTDFQCALNATRAGNIFTIHIPVAAGFDRFDVSLVTHYLNAAFPDLQADLAQALALGKECPENSKEPFNMAWLAIHGSIAVNGVSEQAELVDLLIKIRHSKANIFIISKGESPSPEDVSAILAWNDVAPGAGLAGRLRGEENVGI